METIYENPSINENIILKRIFKEERGEGVCRFIGHRKLTSGGLLQISNELPDSTKYGEFLDQQRKY
jgi:hypothetical protein